MKKLLLALLLLATPAWAVDPATTMGDANYTGLATDTKIVPTVALTATRTITLPSAGATCVGQGQTCGDTLEVIDAQGVVGGANSCLSITPATGETINGSASALTFCATRGRLVLQPLTGTNWFAALIGPGQLPATTTNDNASAGYAGEFREARCPGTASTATVTITIATPGVITWTSHPFSGTTPRFDACPVIFTTTGALPTGITSGTTYYVIPSTITANTFQIATTIANAIAGTAIATSGTQSGTQTGTAGVSVSTGTAADVTGMALTAGDWECRAVNAHVLGASTSVTILSGSISTTTATAGTRGTTNETLLATAANVMGVNGTDIKVGPHRLSLSATTNIFLVQQDTFTVSTNVGYGSLACRRAR